MQQDRRDTLSRADALPGATVRGSIGGFLLLTFGITWALWLPTTLAEQGILTLPLPAGLFVVLGTFGPMLAAVAMVGRRAGWPGVRALLGRALRWHVSPVWYAVVFIGPLLYQLAGMGLHALLGGRVPDMAILTNQLVATLPVIIYMLLFVGPAEEIGWRGYLLPALQLRLSAVQASLVVGIVWAIWHLPLFFNPAMSYSKTPFALWVVFLLPYSILLTALYNRTGGNLLLPIILHAVVNATSSLWRAVPDIGGTTPPSADAIVRVYVMQAVVLWVLAAGILIVDRRGGVKATSPPRGSPLDCTDLP